MIDDTIIDCVRIVTGDSGAERRDDTNFYLASPVLILIYEIHKNLPTFLCVREQERCQSAAV